jgi:hypothetical protein
VNVVVTRSAAWAPGLEDAEAWDRWKRAPSAPAGDAAPDVSFLPPLVRRRCSAVVRLMLHAAHACAPDDDVATVFASRHGDSAGAVEIMEDLARDATITAGTFSHSVHNTAAGLYSIVRHNALASTSTAAVDATFGSGLIEALGLLHRVSATDVLLVVADAPPPAIFTAFTTEPSAPYAVGLLLALDGPGERIDIAASAAVRGTPWPDALEFVRWLDSTEPAATIGRGRNGVRCSR